MDQIKKPRVGIEVRDGSDQKNSLQGVPVVAQQDMNLTSIHEDVSFDSWPRSMG